MVTIRDVAKKAGVSVMTVSRVINGKRNVKESTREKVLKAIEELGYVPNSIARSLILKKNLSLLQLQEGLRILLYQSTLLLFYVILMKTLKKK